MKKIKIVSYFFLLTAFSGLTTKIKSQTNTISIKNETNKTVMKNYVLLIRVPLSYGPADAAAVREKWATLTNKWKEDNIFVTSFVFPTESYVISGMDRTVKKESVISNDTKVITTIVLKAASYEEAIGLAKLAPIIDQGATIEVREVFPSAPALSPDKK